ncbi:MAG: GNAT family N-acetyltransferase [Candidatus Hodarchaeota archaeon]
MHKLLLEFPSKLETARTIIRKYEKGDGEEYLALLDRNDNREKLKDSVDEAIDVVTWEQAEVRIREHAAEWAARKRMVMGVWHKESSECIGQIWIEPRNWDVPSFEIGWFLDSGYWKKGLATEAAMRSVKFLFEDVGAYKLIAVTRDYNERSWKLAERLGFKKEGHLRESSIKGGRRWGLLYYGMLKREFEAL